MILQNPYQPPTADEALAMVGGIRPGAVCYADPIAKAVDDWITMERKAKAWDALLERLGEDYPELVPGAQSLLTAVSQR